MLYPIGLWLMHYKTVIWLAFAMAKYLLNIGVNEIEVLVFNSDSVKEFILDAFDM
jgi:hypothetical protein